MTTISKIRYSRRSILKSGGAALAATALPAPMVWGQESKNITLRQFGTGVSNLNEVATKVKEDLGITLEMTALDTDSVTQRAATQPDSFDIADIEYFVAKKVWAAPRTCWITTAVLSPPAKGMQWTKCLPRGPYP